MSTIQLQRAILWAFLATLIAVIGVTTVAWIRRPRGTSPAPIRGSAPPLLMNEPDGTVYDVNLKIDELQRRLSESETHRVDQQKRLDELQRQRKTAESRLKQMEGAIAELREQVQRVQQAPPATSPPASQPPNGTPGSPTSPPPGGAVPTPVPPAPAAPP